MSSMLSICLLVVLVAAGTGQATEETATPAPRTFTEVLPPLVPLEGELGQPGAGRGSAARVVAEFLSDPNPAVRVRGIESYEGLFTLQGAETLLKALWDDEPVVRHAAAVRMGEVPAEVFIAAVWESDAVRPAAFWEQFWRYVPEWRAHFGQELHAYLAREDITGEQAALAAYALGLMRHEEAGALLARRAWVQHAELAHRCAEAVLRLGSRAPADAPRALLRHPMVPVRLMAVQALGQQGDKSAMEALHATVLGVSEWDLSVRRAAIAALAEMEFRTVLPVLIDLMGRAPGLNWELRQALIVVAEVDNGPNPATWREWYEAVLLFESGRTEEANRKLEVLQQQRSLRLR